MSAFFNMGSLALGLLAMLLPLVALIRRKAGFGGAGLVHVLSLGCCAASLCFQIYEVRNRTHLDDFSAIMDTIDTISWVSALLIAITVVLNLIIWWGQYQKQNQKKR